MCGLKGPAATRMKQNTMATTPPAPMPPSSSESLDASVVATSASPPLARSPVAAVLTAVTVDRVLEPASVPLTMSVEVMFGGAVPFSTLLPTAIATVANVAVVVIVVVVMVVVKTRCCTLRRGPMPQASVRRRCMTLAAAHAGCKRKDSLCSGTAGCLFSSRRRRHMGCVACSTRRHQSRPTCCRCN